MSTIFRLKFAHKSADETGAVKNVKTEYLVECENYTDAEEMAYAIIDREAYNKLAVPTYEIIKTKYDVNQIKDAGALGCDEKTLGGLDEYYFSNETDGVFAIKAKVESLDERNHTETLTVEYLVCDSSITNAINYVKDSFKQTLPGGTVTIVCSKLDAAYSLFLKTKLTY